MFFPTKPRGVCPRNGSSPHTTSCAQQPAPLLAAGRDMDAHRKKVPGLPCPCCPLCFPLALCYSSCRLPQWFPGSVKLLSFLLLPQLVILEIAVSEDKVQRWHRSTSLGSSSKVHISLQAGCPSPHFLRTKQLMLSPSLSLLTLSSRCSRGEECKQSLRGKMGSGDMDLPSASVRTAYP